MDGTRRIVILGKTGTGKSSLANTIFGEKLFKSKSSPNSETSKCEAKTKSVNGRRLTLIDTPGFFDTNKSEKDLKTALVKCITECSPGPHAFLIVLKVERYTEHEQAVIDKIQKQFSVEAFKYATVVFTHGDQLDEGQTIKDFVLQNKCLSDLVQKCGDRCHVIDSKYWNKQHEYRSNEVQVEKLLKTIDKVVEANKGGCYTNEMLEAVETIIQKVIKYIRKQFSNLSMEELREWAKREVREKGLICLVGVAVGGLLGVLCGKAIVMITAAAEKAGTVKAITVTVELSAGAAAGYKAVDGGKSSQEEAKRATGTATDNTKREGKMKEN